MDFHKRWIFSLEEKGHICECVFRFSPLKARSLAKPHMNMDVENIADKAAKNGSIDGVIHQSCACALAPRKSVKNKRKMKKSHPLSDILAYEKFSIVRVFRFSAAPSRQRRHLRLVGIEKIWKY